MASIFELHAQMDELLADFPPSARMKASAKIMTALLQAQREKEREISDMEAARLLPLGVEVAKERLCCHKSTIYRRASRSKIVARLAHNATG